MQRPSTSLVTIIRRRYTRFTEPGFFARTKGHQLLWIQAEDRPPFAHFGDYSKAALEAKKRTWLRPNYHARKTEGIASLLPFALDMPYRITDNHGKDYKEYNICKGTICRAKALQLHEIDEDRLKIAAVSSIESMGRRLLSL